MKRFLLLVCLLFAACFPKHIDPELVVTPSPAAQFAAAQAKAAQVRGWVTGPAANTHSMEPLIYGGDRLVIQPIGLDEVQIGQPILYRPQWDPSLWVAHRVVGHDSYGWLVEGDNVSAAHPESHWRVTKANYVGLVVGIYRVKP